MDNKDLVLDLNELNLDELEDVNGGSYLGDLILRNDRVTTFINEKKIAGIPLQTCINLALEYLRPYVDQYFSREDLIVVVNKIYGETT